MFCTVWSHSIFVCTTSRHEILHGVPSPIERVCGGQVAVWANLISSLKPQTLDVFEGDENYSQRDFPRMVSCAVFVWDYWRQLWDNVEILSRTDTLSEVLTSSHRIDIGCSNVINCSELSSGDVEKVVAQEDIFYHDTNRHVLLWPNQTRPDVSQEDMCSCAQRRPHLIKHTFDVEHLWVTRCETPQRKTETHLHNVVKPCQTHNQCLEHRHEHLYIDVFWVTDRSCYEIHIHHTLFILIDMTLNYIFHLGLTVKCRFTSFTNLP